MPIAVVTGASRGFGRALTMRLLDDGWSVVADARDSAPLEALHQLPGVPADGTQLVTVQGDVTDRQHRAILAKEADRLGGADLLVHNASTLGPSPLPALANLTVEQLQHILEVNVIAPLALTQVLLPQLRRTRGTVVTLSSDAAVEAYPGWGGYGLSKAALDHLAAVLAVEEPTLRVLSFDPGDMRTAMHQAAFPGEDISDRPLPETVVPSLLRLLGDVEAQGRVRA
jgi:NAD(P)-dependent dehydrogenase (short-subunit alcohol dehydrogenase family)